MALDPWALPVKNIPSGEHSGHGDRESIYLAAGKALSAWEHLESGLTRLFQLLCETPSIAACRAYGVVDSCHLKSQMLRTAAIVFFERHKPFDDKHDDLIKGLITAYERAQQARNNIAHGMVTGYLFVGGGSAVGYFLCPHSGTTKKRKIGDGPYFEKIDYFYDVSDIQHCFSRFNSLLSETMKLIQSINDKYAVLENWQFHP
jgi:hypothetical protein